MENKQKKGLIYKIEVDNELIYIGSTTNMRSRKNAHKTCCFNEKSKQYNCNIYKIIRDKGITKQNFKNRVNLIWMCDVEYNKRYELNAIEAEYIRLFKPIGNSRVPYEKEWNIKQYHKQYHKDYYQNNKDKIKQRNKEYYQDNKDKVKQYYKQHYQDNKDKIKQSNTKYLKLYKSKKKCLFCSKWIRKSPSQWNKHINSNKHKKNLIKFIDDVVDTRDSCLNAVATEI